jgi:uncharacterized protein YndB with AHSA1/START domain
MSQDVLLTNGPRPAVRLERQLPDPPSVVWQALTEREQLQSWFPCDVVVDGGEWTVGAAISFPFPPDVIDMTLRGVVLAVEKPRLLSYSWGDEILRFELRAHDGGTRLVLIDELPAANAARNAAGWDECLDRLVGREPGKNSWKPRFDAYASAFAPIIGAQEGPPTGYKGG